MDPRLVAAVIAGLTSVIVASLTAYVTTRQGSLSRKAQHQLAELQSSVQASLEARRIEAQESIVAAQNKAERELEHYRQQLKSDAQEAERFRSVSVERDRFWGPLRDAAEDLGHRLRNIREQQFTFYFGPDQARRGVAIQSTFYRFAKYWGAAENVYGADPRLELLIEKPRVRRLMVEIGRTFATDRLGREFMVWREEQRAIGELILDGNTGEMPRPIIGFASFVRCYEDDFESWFGPLSVDLDRRGIEVNARLAQLQSLLDDLVKQLGAPVAEQHLDGDPDRGDAELGSSPG